VGFWYGYRTVLQNHTWLYLMPSIGMSLMIPLRLRNDLELHNNPNPNPTITSFSCRFAIIPSSVMYSKRTWTCFASDMYLMVC